MQKIQMQLWEEIKTIEENLSAEIIQKFHFPNKVETFKQIHFPANNKALSDAEKRIKFEEFFFLQLGFLLKKINHKSKFKSYAFDKVGELFNQFYENYLPFSLTNAQKKVMKEIRSDLNKNIQMNRLLQGDVGSGKTIIALLAMLIAADNGFQSAFMAPTEILAQQHFQSIQNYLSEMNVKVALLTGSTTSKERKFILEELKNGEIQILIGTHALIEDKVQFENLGLTIIDEQHKFGVAQRAKFLKKNKLPPHVLVMTATPIPRTLAMSLYGFKPFTEKTKTVWLCSGF